MSKRKQPEPPPSKPSLAVPADLGLEAFESPSDDFGLSLEELSQTYAALLGGGDDPYQAAPAPEDSVPDESPASDLEQIVAAVEPDDEPLPPQSRVDQSEITPLSILEAMLFVGHPANEPLTSTYVAALMRGVTSTEIDEWVQELNGQYAAECAPYWIESVGAGYRLTLRPELSAISDKFHGRVREARLSQANIDVLAIVAYNQPVTREQIDKLRGRPSGAMLSQLVRRELLRIDRPTNQPRTMHYYTTDRFLDLYGLETLEDLPRTSDSDRVL